ncbi:hypothetical protein LTR94_025736 [Friedmanniomyces endolithicus]|nr:hypothetical protein LTR94_025736 [Friedmanniomyces endolithicus]
MSSHSVPWTAKVMTGCAVGLAQGLLISALMVDARPPRDMGGEAPVIHLTLEPVAAFDGEAGAQTDQSVGAVSSDKVKSRPSAHRLRSDPIKLRPLQAPAVIPLAATQPEPATTVSDNQNRSTDPLSVPESTRPLGAAQAATASRQGMTQGGAGRVVGAAGRPSADPYQALVLRWIEQHKGNASGNLGAVTVAFTLDRRGRIHSERILASSGRQGLDDLTVRKLRQASPFPRAPHDADWRTRDFVVKIDYQQRS